FIEFYKKGMSQFLPFVITIVAILFTDLLIGISIGLVIGLIFVIKANYHAAITLIQQDKHYTLLFNKDVTFLNKALLRKFILTIQAHSTVTIDARQAKFIDHDIVETINDFLQTAEDNAITVEVLELYGKESMPTHESIIIQ
ncbi:MAG: SulP family inorganic anion transporter, partial [Methylovulum sp.]|nr:SulP family inorganic anion transporter [Methylovulum sp.]